MVVSAMNTCPALQLPKPFALAALTHAAAKLHRIVPPASDFFPSYYVDTSDPAVMEVLTKSICSLLSPSFLDCLNVKINTDRVAKAVGKHEQVLDDLLSSYEGLGDHPTRLKHVNHARRIMDANVLLDIVSAGNEWHVDRVFSAFDSETYEGGTTALSHAQAVGVVGLGNFLVNPNPHEIRLVKTNSRHLAGAHPDSNPVYVEFRSMSHSGPLVVSTVFRRYAFAMDRAEESLEREALPKVWKETDVAARRINREEKRLACVRDLHEEEALTQINGLRLAVLKCCNEFETKRAETYVFAKGTLTVHVKETETLLRKVFEDTEDKLEKFTNDTKSNMDLKKETEVKIVKAFRESSNLTMADFGNRLKELLAETASVYSDSKAFHLSLQDNILKPFEAEAYEGLSAKTFVSLDSDTTISVEEVQNALRDNSAKFQTAELAHQDEEKMRNEAFAKELRAITDEGVSLATSYNNELSLAVKQKVKSYKDARA